MFIPSGYFVFGLSVNEKRKFAFQIGNRTKQTRKQTERQTDRQTVRKTKRDRQTDRHRQTDL